MRKLLLLVVIGLAFCVGCGHNGMIVHRGFSNEIGSITPDNPIPSLSTRFGDTVAIGTRENGTYFVQFTTEEGEAVKKTTTVIAITGPQCNGYTVEAMKMMKANGSVPGSGYASPVKIKLEGVEGVLSVSEVEIMAPGTDLNSGIEDEPNQPETEN